MNDLKQIPAWEKSQESIEQQLGFLVLVANRLGLFAAADAVTQITDKLDTLKYACHVDVVHGAVPSDCVIDSGEYHLCTYAREGMRKEQCEYWRVVTPHNAIPKP